MKKHLVLFVFCLLAGAFMGSALFAQETTTRLVPGTEGDIGSLLNSPALIKPAEAVALGKNWFRLDTDAHVITDQASFKQIAAVLCDYEGQVKTFDGKKSKLSAKIVSRNGNETTLDVVSVSISPLITVKTPYRAVAKIIINTDTSFAVEIRQTDADNHSNNSIKNLYATRYAEEVIINGKTYTYIRTYGINDVNAKILPSAKNTLERGSGPAYEEALQLVIQAAKTR